MPWKESGAVDERGRFVLDVGARSVLDDRCRGRSPFVAYPLAGEQLGLVEVDYDIWRIRFYDHGPGRFDLRTGDFSIKAPLCSRSDLSPMSPVAHSYQGADVRTA